MFSIWNPTPKAQDLLVTFYYWDGSGSYVLPLHLAGHGSKMIDMKVLATSGQLEAHGHAFKPTETAGSAIIRNAAGERTGVTLVVAGGTYNPETATCGTTCVSCCGYNGFLLTPSSFFCPVGWSMQCGPVTGTDCNGHVVQLAVSSWSTSNTSVATINSSGLMNAIAVGSVNISATLDPIVATSGTVCFSGGTAYCPEETPSAGASATVDSLVFTITSGGAPNDPQGAVARQSFNLRIQAKSPSGVVPDTNFNTEPIPFSLQNMNTSVGESAPSTVSFSSGTANASVTIVQASGLTNSTRTIVVGAYATGTVFYPNVYMNVVATREGLVGQPTACPGYVIPANAQMVATRRWQ